MKISNITTCVISYLYIVINSEREAGVLTSIKPIFIVVLIVVIITVIIPAALVLPFAEETSKGTVMEKQSSKNTVVDKSKLEKSVVEVAVYRSESQEIQKLPLEKYIVGVVAAEMPADFELEALKAQALTARTYIMNRLLKSKTDDLPLGAQVTDTVEHQVYKSDEELQALWKSDYQWKSDKIAKAVLETEGQILTYDGEPITATFFSTSNGYTENSEAYWKNPYPYLKSVASPWDEDSPKFHDQKVISVAEFEQKIGVKLTGEKEIGAVVERTPGNRVGSVEIGEKIISGKQIREKLELKSTDFEWKRKNDSIIISTKGYGHGVGMSQYGANGMAQEGKSYKDIVKYYYQGIEIVSSAPLTQKIIAQK